MFIEEINFKDTIEEKDIIPFKKDCKINFWWEKEIQKLISFYKNDAVAKRFKINCILANNWGWKSRLFEMLKKHFMDDSIIFLDENWKIISKNDYEVILDDFFVLSNSKDFSINKELLKLWYNNFYCNVFNFLQLNNWIKDLFSIFLNLDKDYDVNLEFTYNLDWRNWKWIFFSWDKEYSDNNSVLNNDIYNDEYEKLKNFFYILHLYKLSRLCSKFS